MDGITYPNRLDYENMFWKHDYKIWITREGFCFIVNADCTGDALDEVMDYLVRNEHIGLYSTEQIHDDYITAGNNGYQFTTLNIRCEKIR